LSQAKVRAIHPPICDYLIKPPGEKDAPDVLACLTAQQISPILMGQGFNIIDAVVSLYFEPVQPGKASRVLHVDLKQSGISNLRDKFVCTLNCLKGTPHSIIIIIKSSYLRPQQLLLHSEKQ